MLWAMSDAVQLAVIGVINGAVIAIGALVTVVVNEYFARKRAKALADDTAAAEKVKAERAASAKVAEQAKIAAVEVQKVAEAAKIAAQDVREVKNTLKETTDRQETKLNSIAEVGLRTEKYCNSALGRALRMTAGTARAKADITHDPVDMVAATLAEHESDEHQSKQDEMDKSDAKIKG
jgi:hypothetical protein